MRLSCWVAGLSFLAACNDSCAEDSLPIPKEAITAQHQEGAPKTVIYIADQHVLPGIKTNVIGQKVQDFQVRVVEGLVGAGIKPGIVLEDVPLNANEENILVVEKDIATQVSPYKRSTLTILERFRDSVQVRGSVAPEIWPLMLRYAAPEFDSAVQKMGKLDLIQCQDDRDRTHSIPMSEVVQHFHDQTALPFEIDCYCRTWQETNTYVPNYENDRKILAPQREVGAAMAAPEEVVVLIAGKNHGPEIERLLGGENVNYFTLKTPGVDLTPIPVVQPLGDDSQGTCAKLYPLKQALH